MNVMTKVKNDTFEDNEYYQLVKYAMKHDKTIKDNPRTREFVKQANKKNINILNTNKISTISKSCFNGYTFHDKFYIETTTGSRSTADYYAIALIMNYIEEFFGFKFENAGHILFDMALSEGSEAYPSGIYTYIDFNNEVTEDNFAIRYNEWKEYCVILDKIADFIDITFGREYYDKNQIEVRRKIEALAILYPNSVLKTIYEYIEHFNLNQLKKAKIKSLLLANIPGLELTTDSNGQFINDARLKKFVELYTTHINNI